jgi:hypothetical protein
MFLRKYETLTLTLKICILQEYGFKELILYAPLEAPPKRGILSHAFPLFHLHDKL